MTIAGLNIVVPLAGPDFVSADGSLKALMDIGQAEPFLHATLKQRPWARGIAPSSYAFVLHDLPETRAFASDHLQAWFPGCRVVFLSHFTAGAAFSSLAGAALQLGSHNSPVVIDLADILYSTALDPAFHFARHPEAGGLALTFQSQNPLYSYLRKNDEGNVVEAAEKRLISSEASAGTYAFRSGSVLLKALAHALENAPTQTHHDLFFVCPLFNGILAQSLTVTTTKVENVRDMKQVDG